MAARPAPAPSAAPGVPTPAPQQDDVNSVIVRNVAPTVDPPTHKVLADFFSFCGNIAALSVAPDDKDPGGQSVMAIVTFESKAAARTAVLLNNALINERAIQVELAPAGFSLTSDASSPQLSVHSVPSQDLPQHHATDDRSQTSVVVSLLAKGYTLQKDALNSARSFDEEHAISKRASELAEQAAQGIRNVDAQLGVSATLKTWGDSVQSKAVELGEQYQVNEKTQAVSQTLGNFGRSVGESIQGAADSTSQFIQQTPVLSSATQTISGWGASIAGVFRDAKNLSDATSPPLGQVPAGQVPPVPAAQVAPPAAAPTATNTTPSTQPPPSSSQSAAPKQ
jgi:hypothetical protein